MSNSEVKKYWVTFDVDIHEISQDLPVGFKY
jgi:hypothetical protein